MTSLRDILGLSGGGVISIVGAGGKTTLLFTLAREIAAAGETVLTTTTTKILVPTAEQSAEVIVSPDLQDVRKRLLRALESSRHVTAGRALIASEDKLEGFAADDICKLEAVAGLVQWILVEADGAKHRPLKAPADHEPVIPACTRAVIAVVGLDALGQPLTEEWVFRSHLYGNLTGLSPGSPVTGRSVAAALSREEGILKGAPPGAAKIIVLNKAETPNLREAGRRIAALLHEGKGLRPDRIIIASLKEGEYAAFDDHDADRMNKAPSAGIVLAAGMSTRMRTGEAPKQLLDAGGKPLLAWTLEAALRSELAHIVLVLGYEADRIIAALGPLASDRRLTIVRNDRYREGMASSLHVGIGAVQNEFPSVMFLLGDQPLVGAATINLLLHQFEKSAKDICVPLCGGKRGNPVIFASRYYLPILGIRGDKGARDIIDAHPDDILSVEINDPRCFLDIDSTEDTEKCLPLLQEPPSA